MVRASTVSKYIGRRYGRLTVRRFVRKEGRTVYFFECRCDCGTVGDFRIGSLAASGGTQSCGCLNRERNAVSHAGNQYRRLPSGENSKRRVFARYRRDAARRGLPFELDLSAFSRIAESDCYYCGVPPAAEFTSTGANGGYRYNGIDRVDNALGYTVSNCTGACTRCNSLKNGVTREIAERMVAFLSRAEE